MPREDACFGHRRVLRGRLRTELGLNVTLGAPPAVPAGSISFSRARPEAASRRVSCYCRGSTAAHRACAGSRHQSRERWGTSIKTVYFTQPIEESPANQWDSLGELAADMRAGKVSTLLIVGSNPAYDAPADLGFTDLLPKVQFSARLGLYEDETSRLCHWHIPAAHPLESWGDARAYDGTVTVIQPLIAPLYGGKSEQDFLALLNGQSEKPSHDIVHDYWQAQRPNVARFDAYWEKTLHDGIVADTAFPPQERFQKGAPRTAGLAQSNRPPQCGASQGLEIVFRPDPTIWDGRFANNGWLQELPKPLTKLTWDAVAMFSPKTAERLGVNSENAVELKYQGRTIVAPAWVSPGHADESVSVFLGYGRTRAGRVGTGVGFDAGWIRPYAAPWIGTGLEIRKTGDRWPLAATQTHSSMEGRDLVASRLSTNIRRIPNSPRRMPWRIRFRSILP